jgi:predicted P-loop ATPase/GTPase
LKEHGVEKLVPDEATLITHAKRLKEQAIAQRVLERLADYIKRKADAATADLPEELAQMVGEALADDPAKPWDEALADLVA